ncbi:MAG: response regulator transcription factor [Bacteroidetes bacterium]|jgi:two-component system, OmpR family, alkaline phosphatase synthesis response regulator PhoP|nr:response regulator transcription factor [Bacteroidota bacterium]MBT4397979.1 response regulator transcription factor [Bacteroidota bacterium]MBT4411489.1 response regulator transcription factor [Bacteroidota bacterium]MBT5426848.1 response regulator transcription factor [Bacteroidota bacterium]MBT7095162.1 response regulator transcription factor [Bacteroidota bacterium]
MRKILIIEDDPAIRMALEDDFVAEGYQVESVDNGSDGLKKGQVPEYDIILLDLMLPDLSGFEVCKQIRAKGIGTPIIMLTAKSQDVDKILGLEIGADDYVTKPFSPRELQARINAVLRRTLTNNPTSVVSLSIGPFIMDHEKHELTKNGQSIYLTIIEYSLLQYLIENQNKVLHRNDILDNVWGREVYVTQRTVDTHVASLRKKIESKTDYHQWIVAVRGIGYKFLS